MVVLNTRAFENAALIFLIMFVSTTNRRAAFHKKSLLKLSYNL
jgi:hypothetical protein